MKTSSLSIILAASAFSWLPAGAETEVDRLRALVAEQERQIQMLEEENAQLKSDAAPRGTATLQPRGTRTISAQPLPQMERPSAPREHTVAAGDTLMKIGRRYNVSAEELIQLNGLKPNGIIHPGQKLKLPGGAPATPAAAATPSRTQTPPSATRSHTVKAGETYYSISRQHSIPVDRLIAANPELKPSALRVGQQVQLPEMTTASPAPALESPMPMSAPPAPPAEPKPTARTGARTVLVEGNMTYGAFAAKHGTTPERLNQLNTLDLDPRTVLARGSELYVPAQP